MVSPPAGAIGRGDAFVLRIAERTGATVLSNDSFQEFHGEHAWLFDDGRLIGGKPVPGVGWIFTPAHPGARAQEPPGHRQGQAGRRPDGTGAATLPAPVKAAELAKAAKKVARAAKRAHRLPDGSAPKIGDVWVPPAPEPPVDEIPEAPETPEAPSPERGPTAGGGQRRRGGAVDEHVREAIVEATVEALVPPPGRGKQKQKNGEDKNGSKSSKRRRRSSVTPPPAVNEPLAFITFVASFPIGSTVVGDVASFTSHGAMVEVALPGGGGVHCYVPLAGLGDPPPTKAREILARGDRREFVLVGLDPPRRVAELALAGSEVAKRQAPPPSKRGVADSTGRGGTGRADRSRLPGDRARRPGARPQGGTRRARRHGGRPQEGRHGQAGEAAAPKVTANKSAGVPATAKKTAGVPATAKKSTRAAGAKKSSRATAAEKSAEPTGAKKSTRPAPAKKAAAKKAPKATAAKKASKKAAEAPTPNAAKKAPKKAPKRAPKKAAPRASGANTAMKRSPAEPVGRAGRFLVPGGPGRGGLSGVGRSDVTE